MGTKALAVLARRLNREAGQPPIPSLYFLTDPMRTPDPAAIAEALPCGTAIVYRHFGVAERARIARQLAAICQSRGLLLFVAADPALARRVGAAGVHWPERMLPRAPAERFGIVTASAHSRAAVGRAASFGADACFLGPVFETQSRSGNAALGLFRSSQIARTSPVPIIALGGVNVRTAKRLPGHGFGGIAAIDAFLA